MHLPSRLLPTLALLALIAPGCDLLQDAASFSIASGFKTITLDTAQLGLTVPGGVSTIPSLPCKSDTECGAQLKCGGKGYTCAAKCGASGCEVHATAEQSVAVDLSQQIKNSLTASAIKYVTVERAEYATEANSLTFDTPKINVLVGPGSATKSTAAGVKRFAEMPPIKKKTTPAGDMSVFAEGNTAIQGFVMDYKNPFRFLGKADLVFKAGDPVPTGTIKLKVQAHFKITPL